MRGARCVRRRGRRAFICVVWYAVHFLELAVLPVHYVYNAHYRLLYAGPRESNPPASPLSSDRLRILGFALLLALLAGPLALARLVLWLPLLPAAVAQLNH